MPLSATECHRVPLIAFLIRYGRTTLREHYERIAVEGQEYDPYTSMFGSKKAKQATGV